jgi:hypothetical protein
VKIYRKLVIDIETGKRLFEDSFEYSGSVEKCGGGGDPTAKAAEQSQASFDNTLQGIFQQQYANQSAVQSFLTSQIEPLVAEGGQGYTPAQLAAQRTSVTDSTAGQFQSAQQALQEQEQQASGGSKLTGVAGATQENMAALDNSAAQTQAAGQEQVTENNANVQQANFWNGVNALTGQEASMNPISYAATATSGSGAVAADSNANTNAEAVSLSPLNAAIGAAGGAAGGLLGAAGKAGGFSSLFS